MMAALAIALGMQAGGDVTMTIAVTRNEKACLALLLDLMFQGSQADEAFKFVQKGTQCFCKQPVGHTML